MSDWHGFILTSGTSRNGTYRVYKTLDTALHAAHNRADSEHRTIQIRTACETPQKTIETIRPRNRK